ncbi:exonuclease domain-containing protein [Streptomyces sp. NPDC058954]|uniref:exonuclease domain-containing protein n=1 Tax=Streptomyces sp. NPDC058954 TaxID=3346677 RepID=UPI0036C0B4CA
MSKFSDSRKLCFDVETTGTNVHKDRIVTAAVFLKGSSRPEMEYNYLINPGIPIPKEASEIHGIYDVDVKERGSDARTALDEIAGRLAEAARNGYPIIAYNLAFDYSMLEYELKRYGLPTVSERAGFEIRTLVDPYVLDKSVDKYRKGKRKLQNVSEHYGVTDGEYQWHEAMADAKAATGIAEVLFNRFPFLDRMGPRKLYASQQRWRREQCESLQAYFRNPTKCGPDKYNPSAVVIPDWPLIVRNGDEAA